MGITFFGGGGGGLSAEGNGLLYKNADQIVGREMFGVYPLSIQNGEGQQGPPVFRSASQRVITSGTINGAITADQALEVLGAEKYVVRAIVFVNASATPGAMAGGVYTAAGKTGTILVPAATTYTTMTDALEKIEVDVDLTEIVTASFIYVSLTTPNGAALTMDVYVLGDVLEYATA